MKAINPARRQRTPRFLAARVPVPFRGTERAAEGSLAPHRVSISPRLAAGFEDELAGDAAHGGGIEVGDTELAEGVFGAVAIFVGFGLNVIPDQAGDQLVCFGRQTGAIRDDCAED